MAFCSHTQLFIEFLLFSIFLVVLPIIDNRKWSMQGEAVAGGHGQGSAFNQLHFPFGLDIDDDDGSVFIADTDNHRIVRWEPGARQGEIIAGGNGRGSRTDQMDQPVAGVDRSHQSSVDHQWLWKSKSNAMVTQPRQTECWWGTSDYLRHQRLWLGNG